MPGGLCGDADDVAPAHESLVLVDLLLLCQDLIDQASEFWTICKAPFMHWHDGNLSSVCVSLRHIYVLSTTGTRFSSILCTITEPQHSSHSHALRYQVGTISKLCHSWAADLRQNRGLVLSSLCGSTGSALLLQQRIPSHNGLSFCCYTSSVVPLIIPPATTTRRDAS